MAAEQLLSETIASNILIAVLQGLQTHGQHDCNQVRERELWHVNFFGTDLQ